jgi:dTDP-4-dehydrorhamnose reductase
LKFLSTVNRGENYNLGYDRIVSPTWTRDLATFVYRIIASGSKDYGTYHFAGKGECSRHEFALSAYHQARKNGWGDHPLDLTLEPEPGKASRPAYTVLSSDKAVKAFDARVTPWEEALGAFLSTVHKEHIEQL